MGEQSSPQQSAQMSISTQGGNQCPTTTPGLEPGQDVGRDVRMPMSDMADLSNALVDLNLPDCYLQPDQVTATPVQGTKEWHKCVTPDLRNFFVHKLALGILKALPHLQALDMLDRKKRDMFAYAKMVEGMKYEKANSWLEYYQMINEKIYAIQTEMDERRREREEQPLKVLQMRQQLQKLRKQRDHPILD